MCTGCRSRYHRKSPVASEREPTLRTPGAGEHGTTKVVPLAPARGMSRDAADRVPTLADSDAVQESLYAKRIKIYPREVHGLFARLRVSFVALTLGIFYLLPWLEWGAGRQAFLIDLPARKFHLFAWTFYPQDLFYLTAILIISALALFLFTAVFGRVWCGFTCPQTVWTEVFLWIERKIDGDRLKQMRLAQQGWTREKIVKRSAKHGVWIAFSLWTGFTFVGYFTPIRELAAGLTQFALGPWETFWVLFYGFATYGNAGFLREQVCLYMCPYARFQSVMFDADTRIISYDKARGEPRGARARRTDPQSQGLGACIDCTLCVQVCPTGIDIRNGLQYACIACAACVDVCDSVMDKMGYARGLIRYTTDNALHDKPQRWLRPRVVAYGAVLIALCIALVAAVLMRVPLALEVAHDRGALYRETADGRIENVYTLKAMNMDSRAHAYALRIEGLPEAALLLDMPRIAAEPGEIVTIPVRVAAPPPSARRNDLRFILAAQDDPRLTQTTTSVFLSP